jgi:hypothetical protein
MMNYERLAYLIIRKLSGHSTASELIALDQWIAESPDNKRFMEEDLRPEVITEQLIALCDMDDQRIDACLKNGTDLND